MTYLHERMRRVLGQLAIAEPQGGAVDYSRGVISHGKGGHGKHGNGSVAPPSVSSLAVEWAEFFALALDMAELDLAQVQGRAPRPEPVKPGRLAEGTARERDRRITASPIYRGRPDAFVAYVEGCSTDLVRKARAQRDLDGYGLPKKKTLTPRRAVETAIVCAECAAPMARASGDGRCGFCRLGAALAREKQLAGCTGEP